MATAGSLIAGFVTYRLARKGEKEAPKHRFSRRKVDRVYKIFGRWGFGAIAVPPCCPRLCPWFHFCSWREQCNTRRQNFSLRSRSAGFLDTCSWLTLPRVMDDKSSRSWGNTVIPSCWPSSPWRPSLLPWFSTFGERERTRIESGIDLRKAFRYDTNSRVRPYKRESRGPEQAEAFIAPDGGWHNPEA